ncbi:MAG: PLP-dependent aminotransferase family protein [Clostridia bacterium]|nr:PLP-dependent aminotransferase family protein [Clostridia bacterium]
MFFADRVSKLHGSAIREMFKLLADPQIISFAGGAPSPALFPSEQLADITAQILKNNPAVALQYGISEGYTPLREFVQSRMKAAGNLGDSDNLIITSGGQQALDLTFKSLINEGDTVAVESPSFIGGLNSIKSYNAKIKAVPVLDDGLDTEALEEIAKNDKIKIVYTIPTFQNPTGITMSLAKRKKMLELAEKYDFFILEDNPYGELRYNGEEIATMKSMDTDGRVIYAGSFSKILSAGMRLGWCVARKDIMEKIIICKQVSDVHTPVLTQMAAYEFCSRYSLDEHIAKSRELYKTRCNAMLSALERYFPKDCSFTRPDGGIFLWCTLPERIDTQELLKKAVQKKVAFVPGATCESDDKSSANKIRLNYSLPDEGKIEKGIKILSEVIAEQ